MRKFLWGKEGKEGVKKKGKKGKFQEPLCYRLGEKKKKRKGGLFTIISMKGRRGERKGREKRGFRRCRSADERKEKGGGKKEGGGRKRDCAGQKKKKKKKNGGGGEKKKASYRLRATGKKKGTAPPVTDGEGKGRGKKKKEYMVRDQ